jgi:class 3 adenylate cyclase
LILHSTRPDYRSADARPDPELIRQRRMSFRLKLWLAMMLVVGAVTTATLLGTQRTVRHAYEQIFEQQFQNQIAYFTQLQETRLAAVREQTLDFVKSVRVIAQMSEYPEDKTPARVEDLYRVLHDELSKPGSSPRQRGPGGAPPFSRFLDDKGNVLAPPDAARPRDRRGRRDLDLQVKGLAKAMAAPEQQQVGYLAGSTENTNARLYEVILTKIIDPADDRTLGALVLAFPVSEQGDRALSKMSQIASGIYLDGEIHSQWIPESARGPLAQKVGDELTQIKAREGRFEFSIGDHPQTVLFRALNPSSAFPAAYQVCVYSLDEPVRVQRDLRAKILLFGGLAMLVALAVSLVLSHGLSGPINALVKGTREVAKGNLETRVEVRSKDEIGQLAESFNQMTEGLALKEKYRDVLDKVTDKRIADDLLSGKVELGGEERAVSVLFCDIRGFTALTQNMEPREVIQMLNEHFTPLTRVVYEHHGVVDKFVGDLIMAVFGAPTSYGNDPLLAVQCAIRMIEERTKQNENSKYKISVGIGVASGKAVAGRMGSNNRLNYTVLGPRVNLASRLCGQAGRMEIVIDEETYAVCRDSAEVEPLPELKLKGFSEPVHAYKLKSLRPA